MHIIKATPADLETVHSIVQLTVNEIYPNYYPKEVVDFFLDYHNPDTIAEAIDEGTVYLMKEQGEYVGTGGIYQGNYIGRLYVLPKYQGKGYGSALMKELESILSASYATALLEASLPSYDYYLRHGYQPKEYMKYEVGNNRVLCYFIMEKNLKADI